MYGVMYEFPAFEPRWVEFRSWWCGASVEGTVALSPASFRRLQSQYTKPATIKKATAPSTPPTIAGVARLELSLGTNGVYLQLSQIPSDVCRDKGDYTKLRNRSVDLPDAASCEEPSCCITILCCFFCNPTWMKSAVHASIALNESNLVGVSSSVTMYGAPELNLTMFTAIDVPVQVNKNKNVKCYGVLG